MLRIHTLQKLFTAAETLARFGSNRDEHLMLMTDGGGVGVVGARAVSDPDNNEAECAVIVRSDLHGLGLDHSLGRLLTGKLIRYLRVCGRQHVLGPVPGENRAMRAGR